MPTHRDTDTYKSFYVSDADRVIGLPNGFEVVEATNTIEALDVALGTAGVNDRYGEFYYGSLWKDADGNYFLVYDGSERGEFYHHEVTDEFTFWACDADGNVEEDADPLYVHVDRNYNGARRYMCQVLEDDGYFHFVSYVEASNAIYAFIDAALGNDAEQIGDIYELGCEVDREEVYVGYDQPDGTGRKWKVELADSSFTIQSLLTS